MLVNGYAVTITSSTAADFSGDGLVDIALGMLSGRDVIIFTNDGTGKYQITSYAIGLNSVYAIAADFNHDGKPDLAFLKYNYAFGTPVNTLLLHK